MHLSPQNRGEQDPKNHTCCIGICHMQEAVAKPKHVWLNKYYYELSYVGMFLLDCKELKALLSDWEQWKRKVHYNSLKMNVILKQFPLVKV